MLLKFKCQEKVVLSNVCDIADVVYELQPRKKEAV